MDAFLVDKKSIPACKVLSIREKSVGTSPVKSSMEDKQVPAYELYDNADTECQKNPYN